MANKMAVLPVLPEWEEMKANFQQMKANVIQAQDQIKRLSTVCWKLAKERDDLTKERDALLEDNVNLQVETFQWQDKVYDMKMAMQNARHRQMYPKRSQRIYENLRIKKQSPKIKKQK
jgi:regulator of replication initiation timing